MKFLRRVKYEWEITSKEGKEFIRDAAIAVGITTAVFVLLILFSGHYCGILAR